MAYLLPQRGAAATAHHPRMAAEPSTSTSAPTPRPCASRHRCIGGGLTRHRCGVTARSQTTGKSTGMQSGDWDWPLHSFPAYLQSSDDWTHSIDEAIRGISGDRAAATTARAERDRRLWQAVREEAQLEAAVEPLLSSFLYGSVLGQPSFEHSLAFMLANRLSNATMLPAQLFRIILQVLKSDDWAKDAAFTDLEAHKERDPSCHALFHVLMFSKGYHALQAYRVAHVLWRRDQTLLALALQSRISEVLQVDIHPAARIGKGILLHHGIGVVIGETAVVGDNCSLLQNVNLGGTGVETGDRHPKIGRNVLIDASATILGNILIGEGSQIAAGALVLSSVPPYSIVAGSPAKIVGKVPFPSSRDEVDRQ